MVVHRINFPSQENNDKKVSLLKEFRSLFPQSGQLTRINLRIAILNYFSQNQDKKHSYQSIMDILHLHFPVIAMSGHNYKLPTSIKQDQDFHFKNYFKNPSSLQNNVNLTYINLILMKLDMSPSHIEILLK